MPTLTITYDDGVTEPVPIDADPVSVADFASALRMVADAQREMGEDYLVVDLSLDA